MSFGEDLRFAYGILLHPSAASRRRMEIGECLKFYYRLTIIPFILFLLFGYVSNRMGFYNSRFFTLIGPTAGTVFIDVLFFWIAVPLGVVLNSFIYQLVSKFFLRIWRGTLDRTFQAVLFGQLPPVLFYWLIPIPIARVAYLVLFPIWGLVVIVISLSVQQRVTRLQAFAALMAVLFLVILMFFILFSALMPSIISGLNTTTTPGSF